jgi:hypothetical protein
MLGESKSAVPRHRHQAIAGASTSGRWRTITADELTASTAVARTNASQRPLG